MLKSNISNIPIITIDGPSGTGKGTVSQKLAQHLGWHYLDSGALFRVLAYAADSANISFEHIDELVRLSKTMKLEFKTEAHRTCVMLDGQDISKEIRSERCGQNASKLAAIQEVRAVLLNRKRSFVKPPGLVTDGRDMGTVVFPDALLKIFLHASEEERAKRRYFQLKEKKNDVSLAQVIDELAKRDKRDRERAHSPLKPAQDAVEIDTTDLTVVQVFDIVLQLYLARSQSDFF